MKRFLLPLVAAGALLSAGGAVMAQTSTTTTTWSDNYGPAITQYSTTQNYASFNDPAVQPNVGYVVPQTVTVYPLPPTVAVPEPDRYSYTIINNRPVVVERTTRRVVHTW
jgi:hypothetical protein